MKLKLDYTKKLFTNKRWLVNSMINIRLYGKKVKKDE